MTYNDFVYCTLEKFLGGEIPVNNIIGIIKQVTMSYHLTVHQAWSPNPTKQFCASAPQSALSPHQTCWSPWFNLANFEILLGAPDESVGHFGPTIDYTLKSMVQPVRFWNSTRWILKFSYININWGNRWATLVQPSEFWNWATWNIEISWPLT